MTQDKTTSKYVKHTPPHKVQFQGELSGLNAAMRIALEKYVAASKKLKKPVTYVSIANRVGVSGTSIYCLKNDSQDVSTQMISRILLQIPDIKPFFDKAYRAIIKQYGYKGDFVDSITADGGEVSLGDQSERLQTELLDAQNKIKELEVVVKTKEEFIEQLLAKLHA